jgi:hypothetical protein
MTWAFRRKVLYLSILVAFLAIVAFLIIAPHLNKAPTCSDGVQNGTETGVDCGGSCQLACTYQVDQISILWARSFKVVPGRYNAVAYLDNHNQNTSVYQLHYKFRFADKDNLYIGSREGSTYVPPSGKFAVFEPAINFGNSIPVYTSFEFTEMPIWIQVPQEKIDQFKILVSDIKLQNETTSPRLSATIKNNSLFQISAINIMAILYDASGNAVSASKTYLDSLNGAQSANINFTWPEAFTDKVITEEIIPIFNIFLVKTN